MKLKLIVIISCLFFIFCKQNHKKPVGNTIVLQKIEIENNSRYENKFYRIAQKSQNVNSYINSVIKTDKSIKNIIFDKERNILKYSVLEDTK
ncbi:hypothetical protein HNQ02_003795 [Flavobacterium sp. 7E]|nr:hypothetical protein [Flavobacterium sp. 7E]